MALQPNQYENSKAQLTLKESLRLILTLEDKINGLDEQMTIMKDKIQERAVALNINLNEVLEERMNGGMNSTAAAGNSGMKKEGEESDDEDFDK